MITYLVSIGYSSVHVGVARTVSTVFELSATWIAPIMIKRIGLVRGGIWSLAWQMTWLAITLAWFLGYSNGMDTSPLVAGTGLALGVALSRVGLWGYDLCAQNIVQDVSVVAYHPWPSASSLMPWHLGGRGEPPWHILDCGSRLPKRVRAHLLRHNHHVPTSRPVPMAGYHQRHRSLHCRWSLRLLLEKTERSSIPRPAMYSCKALK
jgi:hypothetical protein